MRLTTEQLKAGWLHPRRVVRNVVARHFADSMTTDPDVTAHAIRGAREFGWGRFLTWEHMFCELPLADEAAFEWVCEEVERTDAEAPSSNQKWHLTTMLARAEIGLLERRRPRLLSLPALEPRMRETIDTRLELAACPPADAWRRLEDHCRMAAAANTYSEANVPAAELLLEPLQRGGEETAARVMEVLRNPPADNGGDDPAEWLTGLMIGLAGRMRFEEAAAPIVDLLAVDSDWYGEEVVTALTRIGTADVVRMVAERYPQLDWIPRVSATTILTRIRSAESAEAITPLLAAEDDGTLRAYLGTAAAAQLDDQLVPLARAVCDENSDDSERRGIREHLVAFSHVSGYELPERDDWERELDAYDDRIRRLGDSRTSPLAQRFPGLTDDDDEYSDAEDDADRGNIDLEALAAASRSAAEDRLTRGLRVGRNEPCPCGSGKKYKRCCLSDAPR
jgi:hypothetical protein